MISVHKCLITGDVVSELVKGRDYGQELFLGYRFLSEKTGFWYDCAGIFNQMMAMVVKGDETSGGWKKRVVACIPKKLQASNPSP